MQSSCDNVEGSPSKLMKIEDRHGISGTPVMLTTNYFRVNKQPKFELAQYRVDFEPEIDVTDTRKKLIRQINLSSRYLFDGGSLYLTQSFPDHVIETKYLGRDMKITLKRTGVISNSNPIAFQLYNLIFREAMAALKLQNIRRDYYDAEAKIDIPAGNLELWPGYITAIRSHESDEGIDQVLLCADVNHKFMRKETILHITHRIMRENPNDWKDKLEREVVGTTVLTDYTNKTYMIDEIDYNMNPCSKFTPANSNEEISYEVYYKQKYNKMISDRQQFMLVSKAKDRDLRAGRNEHIYLIPELCRATGLTDAMRNNFNLMKDLSEFTRLNPAKRVNALQKFNKRLHSTQESINILSEWNMELEKSLMSVPGRELPQEYLVFGNNNEILASDKGEWAFRNGATMYESVKVTRWVLFYPDSMNVEVDNFLKILKTAFEEMRVEVTDPIKRALKDDRESSYIQSIRDIAPKNPKMVLIVLPTNRADRYSALKRTCLVEKGIPCQVIIKRTLNHRHVASVASKVAVQMNAKMGGRPWMIKLPPKGLMIVGFDVSLHPRDKSRSIGALVASMDLKITGSFYSITTSYRDGNEMNSQLAHHMLKAIEAYKNTCGAIPERIIFYRDGVGEGQIQYVRTKEIEPLVNKFRTVYGEDSPKLAYIILNKRINSRMFKKAGSSYINPKPGTVIDRQITLPERNDFFLISQHVGQGTVSPTSYNIILNETGLSKDKLEILTYKFTHLYFNWSGTTRIPAVCQYAKKLAFMTSQSLEAPVHENLVSTLYFL